ncbi:MAG TPA: hypothetical protein VEC99_11595, partial [Clostridia bacterium]|nr:hypothetical protein [Clostridia bacterium]
MDRETGAAFQGRRVSVFGVVCIRALPPAVILLAGAPAFLPTFSVCPDSPARMPALPVGAIPGHASRHYRRIQAGQSLVGAAE